MFVFSCEGPEQGEWHTWEESGRWCLFFWHCGGSYVNVTLVIVVWLCTASTKKLQGFLNGAMIRSVLLVFSVLTTSASVLL